MAKEDYYISNGTLNSQIAAIMLRYGLVNPWLAAEMANLLAPQVTTKVSTAYDEALAL